MVVVMVVVVVVAAAVVVVVVVMVVMVVMVVVVVVVTVVAATSTCQRPVHRLPPHSFNSRMLATPKRHTGTQTTTRIHPDDATD